MKVTLILSVCSIVLGTALSCVFCAIRRSKAKLLMNAVIELINGMPIVLFLMICFYVIFSGMNLPEIVVAVIAFSIDFGCRGAVTFIGEAFRRSNRESRQVKM